MKKLLLSTAVLLALCAPALACSSQPRYTTSRGYVDECGNIVNYAASCSNCALIGSSSGSTTVCCSVAVDDSTLAAWAAKKAVESQQSSWWRGKTSDLSREEVDSRTTRLAALKDWAKGLSNHIFATAYCDWADARLSELAERRKSLDQLDVALSLVKGLPTPPETK